MHKIVQQTMVAMALLMTGSVLAAEVPSPTTSNPALFEQKLGVVERFLNNSNTSKKVGDPAPNSLMEQARQKHRQAQEAKAAGAMDEAFRLLDESLKMALQASKVAADPASKDWYYKAQYEDLLETVNQFRQSYARNVQRMAEAGHQVEKNALPQAEALVAQAQGAFAEKRYLEAKNGMAQAKDLLVQGLKGFMDSKTVIYEQKYTTPKEEYTAKLERGNSLETLVRMALSENKLEGESKELIKKSAMESRSLREKGMGLEASDDLIGAIATLDQANALLMDALRATGSVLPY